MLETCFQQHTSPFPNFPLSFSEFEYDSIRLFNDYLGVTFLQHGLSLHCLFA